MYVGAKLADAFHPHLADEAVEDLADAGGAALTRRAAENTPVRFGATKRAWRQAPVERTARGAQSGAENTDFKARWVEYGTGPHLIEPKDPEEAKALELPDGRVRRRVDHPGARGCHPLGRAAAEIEAEGFPEGDAVIEEFKVKHETASRAHKGIT